MSNFLSQLTASERARLLEELNYMNLEEIRGFCSKRGGSGGCHGVLDARRSSDL